MEYLTSIFFNKLNKMINHKICFKLTSSFVNFLIFGYPLTNLYKFFIKVVTMLFIYSLKDELFNFDLQYYTEF